MASTTVTLDVDPPFQVAVAWFNCLLEDTGATRVNYTATPCITARTVRITYVCRTELDGTNVTVFLRSDEATVGDTVFEYADPTSLSQATNAYLLALLDEET